MSLHIRVYCYHCKHVDREFDAKAYSVNIAVFNKYQCRNCKRVEWQLDVYMKKDKE